MKNSNRSRFLKTIIGLVAIACVLAVVFICLQIKETKPTSSTTTLTDQQKAQYIAEMQAIANGLPSVSTAQKATIVSQMQSVARSQPTLSPEQKAAIISAMQQAQLQNNQ